MGGKAKKKVSKRELRERGKRNSIRNSKLRRSNLLF